MIRKSSKQRDMVLKYMKAIEGHVTPEQVFHDMNANGQNISLATVYRNLNILCEMHEINKIVHPIDGYQYDRTCEPHYHLHCTECNRILDLKIPYAEAMNEEISKQTGLPIKTHSMIAEGICEDCLNKQKKIDHKA